MTLKPKATWKKCLDGAEWGPRIALLHSLHVYKEAQILLVMTS